MKQEAFETISGVEIFPIISLIIFVAFFTVLAIYSMKVPKRHVDKMKNIPLGETETNIQNT